MLPFAASRGRRVEPTLKRPLPQSFAPGASSKDSSQAVEDGHTSFNSLPANMKEMCAVDA